VGTPREAGAGIPEFEREDFLIMLALKIKQGSFALGLALVLLPAALAAEPADSPGRPVCLVSNERTGLGSRTLQDAVDAAVAGDTLIVKGTCFGNSVIDKYLTLQGVSNKPFGVATLDGIAFSGSVLGIRGELGGDVQFLAGAASIENLTITHGAGDGINLGGYPSGSVELSGTTVADNGGSGIICAAAFCDVSLVDSTVSGNAVGGVYGGRGSVSVLRSSVSDNGECGIATGRGSSTSVTDSTVSGNGLCGMSFFSYVGGSSAWVTDSTVSGNGGAGIVVTDEAGASISGSTISGNHGSGIALVFGGAVSLLNSSVTGNSTSGSGGGINAGTGFFSLINTAVTSNTAGLNGGGIYIAGPGIYSASTLTDSTISNNTATSGGGIYNNGGSITLSGTNIFANNVPDNCVGVVGC
jgi:hypothetical protein